MGNQEDKNKIKEYLLYERYKEAKITRRIVFIVSAIILLLAAGMTTGAVLYVKNALKPVNPNNEEEIVVEIPLGSGTGQIAEILEEKKIIKDATVFKYYAKFNNESDFQAGTYRLTQSMTFDEIIESLKTGTVIKDSILTITIPEGLQLKEIAAIIAEHTHYSENEILKVVNSDKFIAKIMEKYPKLVTDEILEEHVKYPLEGYLFPATYGFDEKNPPIEEIIITMIDKTNEVISHYMRDIEKKDMTVHYVLTMASLIEEEATMEEDRKQISSVFYNRLEEGMPLQTDPTVIYALGEHRERLTYKDYYNTVDPYNTYITEALPPGPIANAGVSSIEAALYPMTTDYFYFLATPAGEVLFSKTLEEHNEKYNQYIKQKD